jgi:hypothetical protein
MLAKVFPQSNHATWIHKPFHERRWSFCAWKKILHLLLKKSTYQILGKGAQSIKFACLDIPCKFLSLDSSHDMIKFDVLYLSFYFFIQSLVENIILNDSSFLLWFRNLLCVCVCVEVTIPSLPDSQHKCLSQGSIRSNTRFYTSISWSQLPVYILQPETLTSSHDECPVLCGYMWLNHDTRTWIPINVMQKKSHQFVFINPYSNAQERCGFTLHYTWFLGDKRGTYLSDIHVLRIFVVFCWRAP